MRNHYPTTYHLLRSRYYWNAGLRSKEIKTAWCGVNYLGALYATDAEREIVTCEQCLIAAVASKLIQAR